MNKSAILAAMLILASSSAYAYENSYAGYSVKDGDPYVRFETNKVYAYSNAQSSDIAKVMQEAAKQAKKKNTNGGFMDKYQGVNSINYYTADEMKEIIGREFSTAYFDAEYEKLALLKRSELNLKSVPTPLLDMDKYNLFENKGNIVIQNQLLKENIDKITPVIKLEEIGDKKAISLKYLYKQMNRLINVDLTLISANDRLYVLTNLNQNGTLYAPKAKQAEGKASSKEATKELKKVTLKEVLQQAIKIENIKAEDVPDSVIKTFHKQHLQLVKNFTTLQPTKEVRKLTFTDKTMDKEIVLPDDWYYAQVKYQLSENTNATITGAGSVHEAKEAAKAVDLEGIFNVVSYNFEVLDKSDDPVVRRAAFDKVADKYLEEYTKAVQHMNSCFITTSVKVKDDGWKNALATPASNQLGVNAFLRDNLQRLKAYRSENFALHDYNYNLDFTSEKANIDINADFMALKSFNFNSKLFLGCKNDIVSLMFFVKKADFTPDAKLTEQINAWKF